MGDTQVGREGNHVGQDLIEIMEIERKQASINPATSIMRDSEKRKERSLSHMNSTESTTKTYMEDISKANPIEQIKEPPLIEDLGERSTSKETLIEDIQRHEAEDLHGGNQEEEVDMDNNIHQATRAKNLSSKQATLLKGNNAKLKRGNKDDQLVPNLRILPMRLVASK
ncbi:hypothetical protein HAX54_001445 [Datura stramonium]|uniref:Uncharacterized protein n=1 Tax=Datura stramonium TaxID=4076 RepID=A0ABS8T3J7_DATST|nr:hypothetical protein [Datura stramonium]